MFPDPHRKLKFILIGASASIFSTFASQARADPTAGTLVHYPSAFVTRQEGSMYADRIFGRHGYLFVPENRSDPHSKTIMIGFWVLPSTATTPRAPIAYLFGGPGHANIDTWRNSESFVKLRRLLSIADVILFDQRGSGSPSDSSPSLQCPEGFATELSTPWQSRVQVIKLYRQRIQSCATAFTRAGVDLRGYTNEQSAADIDDLRRGLGYSKLNIWGYSYGSYLARTFVDMYPGSVERAFIGGNMAERPSPINPAIDAFRHIETGFTTDEGVKISGDARLPAAIAQVRNRLSRGITVSVKRPDNGSLTDVSLGVYDFNFQVVWALASPTSAWPKIAMAIHDMARGDFSWLAQRAVVWRLGEHRSFVQGKLNGYLLTCTSLLNRAPSASEKSNLQTDPFQGEVGMGPLPEACGGFAGYDLPSHQPWHDTNVEIFFYNGSEDPQTSAENARENLTHASKAELVVVNGASHYLTEPQAFYDALAGAPIIAGRIRYVNR